MIENTDKQPKTQTIRKIDVRDEAISSEALFGSLQRIWIDHKTERYELRVTKQGKLILTK